VGVWVVYGAIRRLVAPPDVHGGVVLVVALVGIAVNLVATFVLSRADRESLNVRGAFLHVATDLVAFVGTAVAGALVLTTGWSRFDPIAGLLVAALMLRSAGSLLRESGRIFMEASPDGLDPQAVARELAADADVAEVHDLHVWTVTSGFPALAAHVLVSPDADCHAARRRLQHVLEERFHLHHVTLQVDHVARREQPVTLRRQ
jgi:cobalt-zinc-cadmium efflux system protein